MLLTNGPTTPNEIKAYEENESTRYSIFSALSKIQLEKVVSLDISYEVWKRLKSIYEENKKFKLSKMQTTKGTYGNLRMEEGEGVSSYFQKVDSFVNEIRDLSGVLDGKDVIQEIMRILLVLDFTMLYVREKTFSTEMNYQQAKNKKTQQRQGLTKPSSL